MSFLKIVETNFKERINELIKPDVILNVNGHTYELHKLLLVQAYSYFDNNFPNENITVVGPFGVMMKATIDVAMELIYNHVVINFDEIMKKFDKMDLHIDYLKQDDIKKYYDINCKIKMIFELYVLLDLWLFTKHDRCNLDDNIKKCIEMITGFGTFTFNVIFRKDAKYRRNNFDVHDSCGSMYMKYYNDILYFSHSYKSNYIVNIQTNMRYLNSFINYEMFEILFHKNPKLFENINIFHFLHACENTNPKYIPMNEKYCTMNKTCVNNIEYFDLINK